MFQSEPICILTAGPTIDGRHIEQQVIDDIAELYDPERYNARINEEHWYWGDKFGSVLSVEKRNNQLWAVLKPNSKLLSTIEEGQLLHTSCEIQKNFADSGKYYLTGLALTDDPASLGTTEIHLSARKPEDKGKDLFSTGSTISKKMLTGNALSEQEEHSFIAKLMSFMSNNRHQAQNNEEDNDMDEEIKTLLTKNTEKNEAVATALSLLTEAVTALSAGKEPTAAPPVEKETPPEATAELSKKVDDLSTQLTELTTKLSAMTDEEQRALAGEGGETPYL
ncbi:MULTISPECIES: GPO family capsid scaffolding protein [unclassified Aliivibrio]|uniref:GPO family capsid scaffolding protein n=1 Tax=unclassified Aliivibrio TaxID=2645654 RepID=UPI002378FCBF|nr:MULTISPECIES: GPO family capsid scaffolding protein [unclassified Aliivibrio]MDD9166486.1 GPO family capsid scaffolding protein [Aliivibrio sp. S4MY2]MDD9187564.1 GPO family capsid scaffolding protein [Aliivibrio sp. S4MY3]